MLEQLQIAQAQNNEIRLKTCIRKLVERLTIINQSKECPKADEETPQADPPPKTKRAKEPEMNGVTSPEQRQDRFEQRLDKVEQDLKLIYNMIQQLSEQLKAESEKQIVVMGMPGHSKCKKWPASTAELTRSANGTLEVLHGKGIYFNRGFLTNIDKPGIIALKESGKNFNLSGYRSFTDQAPKIQVATLIKRNLTALQHKTGFTQVDRVLIEPTPRKRKNNSLLLLDIYSSPKQRNNCDFDDLFVKVRTIAKNNVSHCGGFQCI